MALLVDIPLRNHIVLKLVYYTSPDVALIFDIL